MSKRPMFKSALEQKIDSESATMGGARKLSLTAGETCEAIGISKRTLRRLELRGLLRSSRALRTKRFPMSEIVRFLEETL